ncbi:MAG: DUF3800 domain-containing protein [Endomicrobiales bacterium]|nr:DUF3800 domain-containing protein [Endomicrobiales bacterium]
MTRCFGFIDETGVLHSSSNQRFFALGLLKCEDTSALYEEMRVLKNRAEAKLDLLRSKAGLPAKQGCFEFKFSSITTNSFEFYYDLISLYFKFPRLQFSCMVIDKNSPKIEIEKVFPNTWDAYISYSKLLIKNNVKKSDQICILADFLGKPKISNKYYEPEIKSLPGVFNATVLESHASLFIQMVDVLLGCVSLDFRRAREKDQRIDVFKAKVCDFLKLKLEEPLLAKSFTKNKPNYFSIWEFLPKKNASH